MKTLDEINMSKNTSNKNFKYFISIICGQDKLFNLF